MAVEKNRKRCVTPWAPDFSTSAAGAGLEERGIRRPNAARSESIEPGPNAFPFVVGLDHPPGPGWHRLLLVEAGFARLEGGASAVTLLPRSLALLPSTSPYRVLKGAGAVLRGCSFGRSLVDPRGSRAAVRPRANPGPLPRDGRRRLRPAGRPGERTVVVARVLPRRARFAPWRGGVL